MIWKELIQECIETTGHSEAKLAADLAGLDCYVSQSTIHRIRSGEIVDPKYSVGEALVRLHRRIMRNNRRRK